MSILNIFNNNLDKLKIIKNPIYFTAFGFGSGFMNFAPGTFGSAVGILIYLLFMFFNISNIIYIIITLSFSIIGIYFCDKTAKFLNYHDHPGIVWDEIVGYLISMVYIPFSFYNIIYGFIIFRLFDITKIWPINYVDKKVRGGLGIMLDDILAGIFTNISLNLLIYYGLI